MALNIKPEAAPDWLASAGPELDGDVPAHVIASGAYERVASLAMWLSAGAFT
jgi:hypothetical protein